MGTIVVNAQNVRLFAIIMLSIFWVYLFIERLAMMSVIREKRKNGDD